MNKRPCLAMAAAFVLGEAIFCSELGLLETCLLACSVCLLCVWNRYLNGAGCGASGRGRNRKTNSSINSCQTNNRNIRRKTGRGAQALLLVLFLLGGGRYLYEARKLDKNALSVEKFGEMKVKINGKVEKYEHSETQNKLIVEGAYISSAYGNADTLPAGVSARVRERYNVPAGRIMIYLEDAVSVLPGQQVQCEGTLMQSEPVTNEGMFDFSLYYRSIGISGSMMGKKLTVTDTATKPYAAQLQAFREAAAAQIHKVCDAADAGMYQAVLLGDKSELDAEISALYQESGISHIIAISGLHLSVIGMGLYGLLRKAGLRGRDSGGICSLLVFSYGILTGASGSALRAVIMMLCRFLAEASGRSYDMLSAVGLSAVLLLWYRPYLLFASGFQLSFMAVLSLAAGAELARAAKKREKAQKPVRVLCLQRHIAYMATACRTWLSGIFGSLKLSLLLQLASLPIVLFHYFQIPVYGIFLNLLVIPLMSYVLYSGLAALALSMVSLPLAWTAIGSGHYILRFYTWLCERTAALPFAVWMPGRPSFPRMIVYYSVLLGLYMWKTRQTKRERGIRQMRRGSATGYTRHANAAENTDGQKETAGGNDAPGMDGAGKRHGADAEDSGAEKNKLEKRAVSEKYAESTESGFVGLIAGIAALGLCVCLMLPRRPSGLEVTALDVGQGDGLVLRAGKAVLTMDIGSSSDKKIGKNTAEPYLKSQGISRIDAAMISHADADHTNGLLYLLTETDSISVGMLILPEPALKDARYDALREAAAGREIPVKYMGNGDVLAYGRDAVDGSDAASGGDAFKTFMNEGQETVNTAAHHETDIEMDTEIDTEIDTEVDAEMDTEVDAEVDTEVDVEMDIETDIILQRKSKKSAPPLILRCWYPDSSAHTEDVNCHSSAVHVQYGAFDMLLTGDMDQHCEREMLANMARAAENGEAHPFADGLCVLKTGHHGSSTSTSAELLETASPRYALISYGRENSYGHPHREVTERLDAYGAERLETGKLGRIRIQTDGNAALRIDAFVKDGENDGKLK